MREWQTKSDNTAPTDTGVLTAAEDNARGEELENAVESAGITADAYNASSDTDLFMLAQSMARYASGGVHGTDGGAANAYVLSAVGSFVVPKAYFEGMTVEFYPANTNTTASTVNAFSIGVKKILSYDGNALGGSEIVAGQLTIMGYDPTLDGGNGAFKLKPWATSPVSAALSTIAPTLIVHETRAGSASPYTLNNGVTTRRLNTVVTNQVTGATLSSFQITLPAGTYRADGYAVAFDTGSHAALIYDVTGSTELIRGVSCDSYADVGNASTVVGRFTLSVSSLIELRHFAAPNGVRASGDDNDISPATHVDAIIRIIKEV